MPTPQNYKNHHRFNPPFHFFVAPLSIINFVFAIVVLVRHWPQHRGILIWLVIMAAAFVVLVTLARVYPLRVQDRLIRLEENLRYQRLLTPELIAASQALTLGQIIALRFASDAELPALVQRTLNERLEPKAIKQSITNWRGDYLRV